jgi:hypothetical protein
MIQGGDRIRKLFVPVLLVSLITGCLLSGCITLTSSAVADDFTANNSVSAANGMTVFEVYTGNYRVMADSPYEMLLVRADGLVYYESGVRSHFGKTSNFTMRQGQLTLDELARVKRLVKESPQETHSKFGSDEPSFAGPYAFVFSPTRAAWIYAQTGSQLTVNFDPFTQSLTDFPDISDEAKALWVNLTTVVKSTMPTDIHPELWPSQYSDGRNYRVMPEPSVKM